MASDKQQLKDGIVHISFEMNRYLYTAHPISLPGHYDEVVRESCLLHSRTIGEFFFGNRTRKDDIKISDYYPILKSKDELEKEIKISESKWKAYKTRTDKKLCHLTFLRVSESPMDMKEKEDLNFERLIELFENNLPNDYIEMWNQGKSYSM